MYVLPTLLLHIHAYVTQVLKINEKLQRQKDELEQLTDQKNKGKFFTCVCRLKFYSLLVHCLELEKQVEKLKQKSAQTDQLNQNLVAEMQHLMSLQQESVMFHKHIRQLKNEVIDGTYLKVCLIHNAYVQCISFVL